MKKRIAALCLIAFSCGFSESAVGQVAYSDSLPLVRAGQTAESRIDYFNPGATAASFAVSFAGMDGSGFATPGLSAPAMGSGSVLVGAVTGIPFVGAGSLTMDQPLASVYRERRIGTAPSAPMYYPGMSVGATAFFLPLAVRSAQLRTTIGVQNQGAAAASASLSFYSGTAMPLAVHTTPVIPPGASAVVSLAGISGLPKGFDGSVVISGSQPVAAAAEVVASSGKEAFAFAGSPGATERLLMPEALCVTSNGRTTSSRVAVQNAADAPARFTVTYYYPVVRVSGTGIRAVSSTSALTPPGARRTFNPCSQPVLRGRKNVIAVVSAMDEGGAPTAVAAVVRRLRSGDGTQSAYAALPEPAASGGKYRVVFPSVEWARDRGERTTIDVMNAAPAVELLAAPVVVTATFYPRTGSTVVKSFAMATRASTSAASAGALSGGSFRGAVILESDSPIAAAATVRRIGYRVADGYGGLGW